MHRKLVLFAVQLEGYLCHFPNCHKYTLTQSIRQAFIDVYNLVTEAQKRYHKKTTLTQLDIRHEQLRMLINLAHELGLFNFSSGRKDDSAPGEHRHLVISRLGHAQRTCSLKPLLTHLKDRHHDLYSQLPKSVITPRRRNHEPARLAGR